MFNIFVITLTLAQVHRSIHSAVLRSGRELHPLLLSHPSLQQNYYKNGLLTPLAISPVYLPQYLPNNINKDIYHSHRNYTHANLLPILIPIHSVVTTGHRLISFQDLSVVPLRHNDKSQYISRRADKDNEEPTNQYRNFYGGYGTGLFFGGHGSGHGFYAYGK